MDIVIKEMKTEDFYVDKDTILELLVETYISNFNISREQSTVLCDEKLNQIPNYLAEKSAILIGAYDGNTLAGFLWLYKHNFFGESRLHINQIIVDKEFRGIGIGKQLMKEAESVANKYEIETLDLFVSGSNLEATNMYQTLGFTSERHYMKKALKED